jgi:hypothetical protein
MDLTDKQKSHTPNENERQIIRKHKQGDPQWVIADMNLPSGFNCKLIKPWQYVPCLPNMTKVGHLRIIKLTMA